MRPPLALVALALLCGCPPAAQQPAPQWARDGVDPQPGDPEDAPGPATGEPSDSRVEDTPGPPTASSTPGGFDGGATAAALGSQHAPAAVDPARLGQLQDHFADFAFDGGQLEFDLYRDGTRIVQVARNRYLAPVVIKWTITATTNVRASSALVGSTVLPAAPRPDGLGPWVLLAVLEQIDPAASYQRGFTFRGRFGDPTARPTAYAYALPFPRGSTFPVLQGFHGKFSHRGSNEFAVDFDCPVATTVRAAREGVVIASNGIAVGAGSTPDYLDYKMTNFILVRHPDGTLGEYMHLAPSGVLVKPGARIARGQAIAVSGNTGFSSTPHLHFQVMTAGGDGISARSFPFAFAVTQDTTEQPALGRRYTAWE